MKTLLIFLFSLFFLSVTVLAQIPNSGFENWTDGNPDSWFTNNIVPLSLTPITQSSEAHSGTSAVRMEIVQTSITGTPEAYTPTLTCVFPISQRYANINGFFRFSPVSASDSLVIVAILYNNNSPIASAYLSVNQAVSSYTEVSAPFDYFTSEIPDSAYITAIIDYDTLNSVGTYALIDDLTFEGTASSIEQITANVPNGFEIEQNYPNPFNPSTNIEYSIPKGSFVELKVYDVIGNEIAELVNQYQNAGTYRVDFSSKDGYNLTSGIYIARFSAGDFTKSIKMTLLK